MHLSPVRWHPSMSSRFTPALACPAASRHVEASALHLYQCQTNTSFVNVPRQCFQPPAHSQPQRRVRCNHSEHHIHRRTPKPLPPQLLSRVLLSLSEITSCDTLHASGQFCHSAGTLTSCGDSRFFMWPCLSKHKHASAVSVPVFPSLLPSPLRMSFCVLLSCLP